MNVNGIFKSLIALLATLGLFASAQSAPLSVAFDDTSFRYYDREAPGFISLAYDGSALTIALKESANPHGARFWHSDIRQPAIAKTLDHDFWSQQRFNGERENARLSTLDELRAASGVKVARNEVKVKHARASLDSIMAAYDAALTELGFVGEAVAIYPNTRNFVYSNGEHQVRLSFNRLGATIRVTVTPG
jgi:hypothetical protein